MTKSEKRQQYQLEFTNSNQNLIVGDIENLPLSLDILKNMNQNSIYVDKHLKNGFTAEVFKLDIDGTSYTLKKKRDVSLVKNVDGLTSFLNEVQRRCDFNIAKEENPIGLKSVVQTIYADYKSGIILSPWVEGYEVKGYNRAILDNLFSTLFNMEKACVFEYDLCSGNILVQDDKNIKFFDFGYAYKFEPLVEYNAQGKESPHFHMAERFETRSFMLHLVDIEQNIGLDKALSIFRMEKEVAIKYYILKYKWLVKNLANQDVIDNVKLYIDLWDRCIYNDLELKKLYNLDLFRSFILDVEDDVSGKSCNPDTTYKCDVVIKSLLENFIYLKTHNVFITEDKCLTQDELLVKYKNIRNLVLKYQLDDLSGFESWKKSRVQNIVEYYN